MNYEKVLKDHNITNADIDRIVTAFQARAQADSQSAHPEAIYHTAAVDIAMGAVDLQQEVKAGMNESHSAKGWLSILTGVDFVNEEND